tara:strand:- start:248 stop:631 length:384 start_codon:yes stop_codon:yes gene_type:complete
MAYNAKEIWIPTDSSGALDINAGANSGYISVKAGGADIPRGLCYGYYFKVSATDSNNTAIPVKLYDASGGRLLYSTTVDGTSLTETVDTLSTPLPFFSTPYFVVGDIQSGASASLTYEVKFFFKALA